MGILKFIVRPALALIGAMLVVQPILVWDATGREPFTRYVDDERAAQEEAAGESDIASLFETTSVADNTERIELPPNRFSLGLMPSTYPHRLWDRDLVSVLTIATPGAIVLLVAIAPALLAPARRAKDVAAIASNET